MKPKETAAEFDAGGSRCVLRGLQSSDLDGAIAFANGFVREKKSNRDLGLVGFDQRVTRAKEGKWLRGIVDAVKKREAVSVAAFVGGKMVGHCDVRRRGSADERHAGVLGIAVLDGYRGVGIGRNLMAEALRRARGIGLELVELQVFANNEAAMALYGKMGFKKAGVIPNKIRRGRRRLDEVAMYADLRGTDKSPSARRGES